jgi:hypothetical protein
MHDYDDIAEILKRRPQRNVQLTSEEVYACGVVIHALMVEFSADTVVLALAATLIRTNALPGMGEAIKDALKKAHSN